MFVFDSANLTSRQIRGVTAILQTSTLRDAAEMCGYSESTLARWLREPAFVGALKSAEVFILDAAIRSILVRMNEATSVLHAVMVDDATSAGIKLRAATSVIDAALRLWSFRSSLQRGETPQTGDDWMSAEDA